MACGGCGKRSQARAVARRFDASGQPTYDVMGGHKYLPDVQIRARLEVYKKRYCPDCPTRYECDYAKYVSCKGSK